MAKERKDKKANTLDDALTRFVKAYVQGEQPDIDEFVEKYPQHEAKIRRRVQSLHEIDALFDSIVQTDARDFEEAAEERNLVGRKIGSFETTKMIGRGGMGVVYLAHDTKLKRCVAIKSMPAKLASDTTAKMRFRREAELLASLNHPNIAVIYDIIEDADGAGYLVLEYVPGETLSKRITREPLTIEQALSIGQQIAAAVSAAHKKGIVHRDLKPGNIKITPDGLVKVLDFGLAKPFITDTENMEVTATQRHHIMGTPAYMSPEQARGQSADHRTDIWSFGCIMYQMLTGKLPFEGHTATDTLAGIIEREPDWGLLPGNTPANIRMLLHRCLEKDPEKRFDNIADIIVKISEALSKPVTAPPVSPRLRKATMVAGAAIIITLFAITFHFLPEKLAQPSSQEIRLVVLPLENLSPVEDEWFADGITDEITSRLAGIHGLRVISRQSAIQYKNKEKSTPQIALELDVDYILEGTIQRENPSDPNSQVRIRCQLIRTTDDTHVWTERYDDNMTEVLNLQSKVAEKVAQALDITLLEPERKLLASRPTENVEAFNFYLRGKEYIRQSGLENHKEIAIELYKKAVDLDPNLALAYAALSSVHTNIYWSGEDRSQQRLAMAEKAASKALELDPDLPEGHLAMARYFYQGHLDFSSALKHLAIVRGSYPNHERMLYWTGNIRKRQGEFQLAVDNLRMAFEHDPLNPHIAVEIGLNYLMLRKYPEAEEYYNKVISLAPNLAVGYNFKAWLYLCWEGDTKKARAVLEDGLHKTNDTQKSMIINELVRIDTLEGQYQAAVNKLSLRLEDIDNLALFIPYSLRCALLHMLMNNTELAKKHFEDARIILEDKIEQQPDDDRYYSALGITCAGLDLKQEAIDMGQQGVEKLPFTKDASRAQNRHEDLAHIFVMVGDFDAAIDKLEFLLNMPGDLSVALLRLDPAWDPLRNHPRFKKLIESDK